ncbi:kelch-like protein 10 [Limulus polyphemus]|uniref:Kelch-like protein diablo n=1 Tax=Limulus polyphemus TaxID=6850 RepID=A0ABM1BJF5_LIMPO|nr:kelch-like protein 10 [Limulus polyphemus]
METDREITEPLQILDEMRSTGQLCDTILRTHDCGKFLIHSAVLSASSPYFKVLFTNTLGTPHKKDILIPGITADLLQLIIKYAYTRVTWVTVGNVDVLLPAADQFNVIGMVKDCSQFLIDNMDLENCIGIRQFAQVYGVLDLEKITTQFLMKEIVQVLETSQEFLELPAEELVDIFAADDLNICHEEDLWEAIVKWIDNDPEDRKHDLLRLMQCVRFGLMDVTFFIKMVKYHPHVTEQSNCRPLINEALTILWDQRQEKPLIDTKLISPHLIRPRFPHEALFIFGGWNRRNLISLIEAYDVRADRWIQLDINDPAGPRSYHKIAVLGTDVYVIGGFNSVDYLNTVWCWNIVSRHWREVAPMHMKRAYVSVALLNGMIYAVGGHNGRRRQDSAEKYNETANQWTVIQKMNYPRSDASATVWNSYIFIAGGFDGFDCISSVEYYDSMSDQWTLVRPMTTGRKGCCCATYNNMVYVLGGCDGSSRLTTGEKFDPMSNTWSEVPEMYTSRSNFGMEVIDDMIYVIGGFNGLSTIVNVECFDWKTNEWYHATELRFDRSGMATCVISGLEHIREYLYKNRENLLEENRQKLVGVSP